MNRIGARIDAMDSQETKPAVVAAVVTWNRPALLVECVRRLLEQTWPLAGVVVFDNGSSPPVAEALEQSGIHDPRLKVHRSATNLGGSAGFAGATEQARAAGADWVWIMDDDAHVELDAAERMVPHFCPEVVAVANYKVDARYAPLDNHMESDSGPLADGCRLKFSSFVGLCVSAAAIDTVGLPDARFFTQCDDNDYCIRLRKVGPIVLARESIIIHLYERLQKPGSEDLLQPVRYFSIRNSLWIDRRRSKVVALWTAVQVYPKLLSWAWRHPSRRIAVRFVTHAVVSGVNGHMDNQIAFDLVAAARRASR